MAATMDFDRAHARGDLQAADWCLPGRPVIYNLINMKGCVLTLGAHAAPLHPSRTH